MSKTVEQVRNHEKARGLKWVGTVYRSWPLYTTVEFEGLAARLLPQPNGDMLVEWVDTENKKSLGIEKLPRIVEKLSDVFPEAF